ncbi:MAG: peptidogalycan biosysnthesis protein, partial [Pseudomonadota bacterium]
MHSALSEVDKDNWDSLVPDDHAFLKYDFLALLESSGCVSADRGWIPSHFAAYSDGRLVGAMPCYRKSHSYGEYIFDWAWADAYYRNGADYYPKLSNAIPFTPATGPRLLICPDVDQQVVLNAIVKHTQVVCEDEGLSGWHSLYIDSKQLAQFESGTDFLVRHSNQFHWQNASYNEFDDFLSTMSSKKRKNIKRERRRITEMGVTYRWYSGAEL